MKLLAAGYHMQNGNVTESIRKSGNDMACRPDTITRSTANKNLYLFHDLSHFLTTF